MANPLSADEYEAIVSRQFEGRDGALLERLKRAGARQEPRGERWERLDPPYEEFDEAGNLVRRITHFKGVG